MFLLAQQTAADPLAPVAPILFFALAGLTVVSAWAIVLSQNIVRMSVYLLLTLTGAAGLYFMLQAEFLAAVQLIVYAGGTLILIVFGVMLTSKNPNAQLQAATWEMMLGIFLGGVVAAGLLLAMVNTKLTQGGSSPAEGYHSVEAIGKSLLSTYLVPFEVAAVLLLAVMVGAAYMARRRTG